MIAQNEFEANGFADNTQTKELPHPSREEALAQIETWLLIPGSIAEVIPALITLHGTPEYEPQKKDIARVARISPSEVDRLVMQSIQNSFRQENPNAWQNSQQNYSSYGQQNFNQPFQQNNSFNNGQPSQNYYQNAPNGAQGFRQQANLSGNMTNTHANHGMQRCTNCLDCGKLIPSGMQVSQKGWILFIVLLFFCWPLCWLPLVCCKEPRQPYCAACRMKRSRRRR